MKQGIGEERKSKWGAGETADSSRGFSEHLAAPPFLGGGEPRP